MHMAVYKWTVEEAVGLDGLMVCSPTFLQALACGSQEGADSGSPGAAGKRSQRISGGWERLVLVLRMRHSAQYSPVEIQPFCIHAVTPVLFTGYTPALSCAPNRDVADCLALILNSMMPTAPMVTIAALPALSITHTVINHHPTNNHISKGVAFDTLPPLRPNHASYCRPERPLSSVSIDDELNDSDSETYWEYTCDWTKPHNIFRLSSYSGALIDHWQWTTRDEMRAR